MQRLSPRIGKSHRTTWDLEPWYLAPPPLPYALACKQSGLLFGEFATLKRSDFQDEEEKRGHGGKSESNMPWSGAARYMPAEASCPAGPCGRWNPWQPPENTQSSWRVASQRDLGTLRVHPENL